MECHGEDVIPFVIPFVIIRANSDGLSAGHFLHLILAIDATEGHGFETVL